MLLVALVMTKGKLEEAVTVTNERSIMLSVVFPFF